MGAAWRLAFAVTGDPAMADAAVEAAVASQVSWLGPPSSTELLGATFREVDEPAIDATRSHPASGDALVDTWWGLPTDQRAALWLRAGDDRPSEVAASILAVAPGAVSTLVGSARRQLVPGGPSEACPTSAALDDLVAERSDDETRLVAEGHLASCPSCRDRYDSLRRLQDIGDPATGPVPLATSARAMAAAGRLPAGAVAAPPEPLVAAVPTAPRVSPSASGHVARAALAAFSSALGDDVPGAPTPTEVPDVIDLRDIDLRDPAPPRPVVVEPITAAAETDPDLLTAEVYGPDHPVIAASAPVPNRDRAPERLRTVFTTRVLAGAVVGVLIAGVVASLVVHPQRLRPFQTVQIRSQTGTTLFPTATGDGGPTVTISEPTPSIIVPGPVVASTVPATTMTDAPATTTATSPVTSHSPATPTHTSSTSHATTTSSSPSATSTTTAQTTTTTTRPPTSSSTTTAPRSTAPPCSDPLGLGC